MWYYSEYTLDVKCSDNFPSEGKILLVQDVSKIADGKFSNMVNYHAETYRPVEWISTHEDMRGISLKYPTVLFILESKGGEINSHKKYYYKNGKIKEIKPILMWPTDEEVEKMGWMG